jgi:hypothetical protein
MKLLTKELRARLEKNGRDQLAVKGTEIERDLHPVVKLFNPCGSQTWLLTEIDPVDNDIAFGLCDMGMGCPELGSVRLSELAAYRHRSGLGIERDLRFTARRTLSAYAAEARELGRIEA